MEVSSSTTASSLQDNSSHILSYTNSSTATLSGPVVSTSNTESDGLNNVVSKETSIGALEAVPVRYGPVLPPNIYPAESVSFSKDVRDSKAVAGSCGLYNLGNTCFMNAGLQSLMSCAPLVKFFCESYTLTDANKHTLTAHFYMLLCKMWSGSFSVVHPRKFKDFLGFCHSQFEDYRQHDCQEFLALLLDTLHEQLNSAPAASKNALTSSLPVTSSSSIQATEKVDQATATVATLKSKNLTLITKEHIEGNVFDLNNKDSSSPVICSSFPIETEGSESRKTGTFLNFAQSLSSNEVEKSPTYTHEGSPASESSALDAVVTSPSSVGDAISQKSPDHGEEDEIISSSFPPLRRYTSRSNLDDVTSSDSGVIMKQSLKRVSSGNSMTMCGPILHSEDSNHSSVSAHSTDSEQSSAFKRLKIDTAELNRNANNILKECVSSSSDCKKNTRGRKNILSDNSLLRESENILVTSNNNKPTSHIDFNVIDNMASSCQEALNVNVQSPSSDKNEAHCQLSSGLPSLDDFYSKETKTLNTNVVVSEFLQEITSDSEKFAKLDNRYRPPSKEINILQEAFGEEDKAEKVLIGHRFGSVKDTNLYAMSTVAVVKPIKNSDANILNNSIDLDVVDVETISKFVPSGTEVGVAENNLPLKLFPDSHKLGEEEKNVQMQAYTKFNTIPDHSNIRTDLIDAVPDADSMEVDEADIESSDEDEVEVASHTSTVEECSSVPNCLRHCSPSEVVMANRSWDEYLARNDSIIVSTFQGQFRSTVVCSECSHVSVTYEPFMYLSLPIPHAMEQQISIVYISQHKPPVRYLLNLMRTDKIGTAKKKLCELIGQEDGDIIIAEVLDSHISRILDNNILLKYVNTFNRKIYAFEMVSIDPDEALPTESMLCEQILNNKESPSLHNEYEVPSSSRTDLPYTTDGQVSNQSFDSINVNSPSSRDTLDYMLSDTEPGDLNTQAPESSSAYVNNDEDIPGGCQSTSGITSAKQSWTSAEYSRSHISWNFSYDSDAEIDASRDQDMASSSSTSIVDSQVHSCTTKFWSAGNEDQRLVGDIEEQVSEDETLVNVACSTQAGFCDCTSPVHKSRTLKGSSLTKTGESHEDILHSDSGADISESCMSINTSVSSTVGSKICHRPTHQISSSSSSSCGSNSRNLSRSCPSPDGVSHPQEHKTTLLDVAARLEENSESCFLHRSQENFEYSFFQEDGVIDTSAAASLSEKPKGDCEDTSWPTYPNHNSSASEAHTVSIDTRTDQWKPCAICLEDLLETDLLTHVMCNGIFCQNCLEMSVKHAADVSAFCCPICLNPAKMREDFVPLASATASKPKIRILPMSIAYRHSIKDNTGSSMSRLFGHPNIIHIPSVIKGDALYGLMDRLINPFLTSYSIMLTDGQGLTCSRCTYSWHCTGCEVARDEEVTLHPSDCLTVHVHDTLSVEQVTDIQFVHEDVTMAGLRSSEPTTIMDCFGAFTQSEILDEHNPWYCPQCKKNQCAKKTMTVWRYPDNLIIHLKRFVYQDLSSTKVDTKVIFPQSGMDVRGFLSGPSSHGLVYDLYSIVCHFGGASSGHYTCYAKHPLTSQWYYYNDETVTAQSPSDSEFTSGYVLYYQRHGTGVGFTPPQTLPYFEDGATDSGVAPSSLTASFITSSNSHGGSTNNSMALVLFQPPITPGQKCDDKPNDTEGRCSPCDYDSQTVHFGSNFPGPSNFSDPENNSSGTHVAEPDSTLDFYS